MTLNFISLLLFEGTASMSASAIIAALYVFALAAFLGYQVISSVPPLLHTPLMSATNATSPFEGRHDSRIHRGRLLDHERSRWIRDYRSHAQDVQTEKVKFQVPSFRFQVR